MTTALLLAAFLAIVVVGGALVALHDAAERAWAGAWVEGVRIVSGGRPRRRPPPPTVACRHLH